VKSKAFSYIEGRVSNVSPETWFSASQFSSSPMHRVQNIYYKTFKKNLIVEGLDYQIPVTQPKGDKATIPYLVTTSY